MPTPITSVRWALINLTDDNLAIRRTNWSNIPATLAWQDAINHVKAAHCSRPAAQIVSYAPRIEPPLLRAVPKAFRSCFWFTRFAPISWHSAPVAVHNNAYTLTGSTTCCWSYTRHQKRGNRQLLRYFYVRMLSLYHELTTVSSRV